MALVPRSFKASASGIALAFAAGCATTGLPQYRSVDAGVRTQNTNVSENGIRLHPDGTPVAINYRACAALNQEIRAATSGNATTRAINQGTGTIGGAVARGKNVGDAAAGAVLGVLIGIGGDQAVRAVNGPRIAVLEADCNQEKAFTAWQKDAQASEKAYQQTFRLWQSNMSQCTARETRGGAEITTARSNCERAYPAPQR